MALTVFYEGGGGASCSSEMQPVQFLALLQRHNAHVTGNTYVMADL